MGIRHGEASVKPPRHRVPGTSGLVAAWRSWERVEAPGPFPHPRPTHRFHLAVQLPVVKSCSNNQELCSPEFCEPFQQIIQPQGVVTGALTYSQSGV